MKTTKPTGNTPPPVYLIQKHRVIMYRKFFKRAIDLVVSVVLFLILLPVMIITGVALWFSVGHIMFLQERVGYGCRKFRVIKLCTMKNTRDESGALLPDAERATRVGDFVRKWSLDELPQLLNIIRGDMSLVGPRPFMECYVANCTKRELRRHWVKPGVTGLAQVAGRNAVSYRNRFRYDVWYVDNYSFRVDMMILLYTARMVLGLDKNRNATGYDPTVEGNLRK